LPAAVTAVRRGRKKFQKKLARNSVEWKLCKMFTSNRIQLKLSNVLVLSTTEEDLLRAPQPIIAYVLYSQ
jgi:hypothetical protein